MPLNIRERSQKIAEQLKTQTKQTIETIAKATGLSKSSVHRHQQVISH